MRRLADSDGSIVRLIRRDDHRSKLGRNRMLIHPNSAGEGIKVVEIGSTFHEILLVRCFLNLGFRACADNIPKRAATGILTGDFYFRRMQQLSSSRILVGRVEERQPSLERDCSGGFSRGLLGRSGLERPVCQARIHISPKGLFGGLADVFGVHSRVCR